jgi:putative transposase
VPRSRDGVYQSKVLPAYARYDQAVKGLITESFVSGVSTRRVGEVLEPMLGATVSAGTVSRVTRVLDEAVRKFHQRPLTDDFLYLFLDGVYLRVKGVARVQKKVLLTVYGVKETGDREVIDYRLSESEGEAEWLSLLNDLYRRGLEGKKLKLAITDGGPGLHAALNEVYGRVSRQRCWVHKLRNLTARLPVKLRVECLDGLRKVYQAENKTQARQLYREWAERWRSEVPKVVESMDKDIDHLLKFMDEPAERAKMLRTTNIIERLFREVRRRTNPMSCFNNGASCERVVYAVISQQNERLRRRPLPQFTHNI